MEQRRGRRSIGRRSRPRPAPSSWTPTHCWWRSSRRWRQWRWRRGCARRASRWGCSRSATRPPPSATRSLGDGQALLVLIAAGGPGEAAARAERAIAICAPSLTADLGQNVARAWAASRYDLPSHTEVLAAAGYRLDTIRTWYRWSRL